MSSSATEESDTESQVNEFSDSYSGRSSRRSSRSRSGSRSRSRVRVTLTDAEAEGNLIETEEEVLYGERARSRAVSELVLFSILLFTVPFAVMYLTYRYFLDHLHLPPDRASLYAGLCAVMTVILIVTVFVWRTFHEEQRVAGEIEMIRQKKTD